MRLPYRYFAGNLDAAASLLIMRHGGQAVPVQLLRDGLLPNRPPSHAAWRDLKHQQDEDFGDIPLATPEEVRVGRGSPCEPHAPHGALAAAALRLATAG